MKLFDLTGKVALVTGGNGGIGLAMAQGMASCGASIVIAGRNADEGGPRARLAARAWREVRVHRPATSRRRRHA